MNFKNVLDHNVDNYNFSYKTFITATDDQIQIIKHLETSREQEMILTKDKSLCE